MRILAVDYGLRRVGLASCDDRLGVVLPKQVLQRKTDSRLLDDLFKICIDEQYEKVVFGLPLDMDGGEGKQYFLTKRFADMFVKAVSDRGLNFSVDFVDERLSSFEAEKYSSMKDKIDMMAAKIILERYLE